MTTDAVTRTSITLPGRQQRFLRMLWIAVTLTVWTLTLLAMPDAVKNAGDTRPDIEQLMLDTGLPTTFPQLYTMTLDLLFLGTFSAVAFLLFWRRSDDRMALYVSLMLVLTAHVYINLAYVEGIGAYISAMLIGTAETMQVGLFYCFPSGHWQPRWVWWLAPLLWVFRVLIWLNIRLNGAQQQGWEVGIVVLLMLVGIGFQVYRYRHQSSPEQRQQVKGVLIGLVFTVAFVTSYIFLVNIFQVFGSLSASNYWLLALLRLGRHLALALFPMSLMLAIMRYRLWEIDLVINRTLVAMFIAAMLAVPFIAMFFGTDWILRQLLGGHQSSLALVLAALVTGLLFNPVRQQAQHFVDRRLYGFRFDLNELKHAVQHEAMLTPGRLTGKMLAGYELLEVIGRGGMGEIYRARQNNKIVAIKVLVENTVSKEDYTRFQRELEVTATLKHPHIVRIEATGESDGIPYMVMEYIDSEDLRAYLKQHSRLTLKEVRQIFIPLSDALDYAHRRGYVHRDIKPSNIMLRKKPDGVLYPILMDFGLAKASDSTDDLTGEGAIGTIDYMAPEQILAAGSVDARADIYALGVMIFEALSGEPPYTGNPGQVLFGHLQQPPPDLCLQYPEISFQTSLALMRALAKQPEDRFRSARELVQALEYDPEWFHASALNPYQQPQVVMGSA